jgi:hypothetical protein
VEIFDKFESTLMNWLKDNSIDSVWAIRFGLEYAYEIDTHTIVIGTDSSSEDDELFMSYCEDRGCRCAGIPSNIMSFLHEVGHSQTIHQMMAEDDKFIDKCNACKKFWYDNAMTAREGILGYWSSPDEAAANEWEMRFINEHQGAVVELYDLWNSTIDEIANSIVNMMMPAA